MLLEDMFFRWNLKRLQKREDKISIMYQADIDKARAAKDWNEEQTIVLIMYHETDLVKSEIRQLQHNYVTKQAERLLLPVPRFSTKSPDWECLDIDGKWFLSQEVLARLGREVRHERRERLELAFLWPASLIGLIGGIAGIATAFFR